MQHDPHVQRLLGALPQRIGRTYAWLARPQAKWIRLPLGVALMAGGTLSFLPVLGVWMLPIGALLVGEDIPPVRRATLWGLKRIQQWWDARHPPPPAGTQAGR